ncbi:MAG: hypothetical protein CL734_03860 [Chloroflexi bacterium]|nr:hypothetical protein [Chloroflexota bacterium]
MDISIYSVLLILQITSSWFMVGLIWLIQIVSYPLFRLVEGSEFTKYHHSHVTRITPIVGIVMLVELISAISLAVFFLDLINIPIIILLLLLGVIWASTLMFQLPYHQKLSKVKDIRIVESLICTNWIRTFAWTLKGVICWWLVF